MKLTSPPTRLTACFSTPYEQYAERRGQEISIVGAITAPDQAHDAEVLPMFKVQFSDGVQIEAWAEEIGHGGSAVQAFVHEAGLQARAARAEIENAPGCAPQPPHRQVAQWVGDALESVAYFSHACALVATRRITWATYFYALRQRPPAVAGRGGSYGIGRL